MHWSFGGHFQPVATVCKYSEWSKCLISFFQYVWFEVVTDVADCLANEAILWRVLSALLTILTIAYLAYLRLQWTREAKRNQEKFKAVNHKIQDIELKVDIVTYKTQYGTWPSQSQEGKTSNNVKNYRFGLSKFTLENTWIKNLLARVDEKKYALEKYSNVQRNTVENYSKINKLNFPPSYYDKNLLSDAEKDGAFGGNSAELSKKVDNGRFNSLIIPPESNLSDRSKNHILYAKENIGAHDKNVSRRKSIALDHFAFGKKRLTRNKDLKVIASISNMIGFPQAIFPGPHAKISVAPSKTSDSLSKPHNTLYEVQEKLKSLYATIHNYNTKNPLVPMLKLDSDSNNIDTSEAVLCEVDNSVESAFLLDDFNTFLKDIDEQQIADEPSNCTAADASEWKSLDEIYSKNDGSRPHCNNTEISVNDSSNRPAQDENVKDVVAKKDESNGRHELLELHSVEGTDTENNSENELTPKAFKEVKPLDDATSALLQEALKFKKQILSNVETQSNGIDIKEEHTSNCSETNSESSLRQSNTKFDSKILDIITEESSISSSTEKKGDLQSYAIEDKNKTAQDKTSVCNEKIKRLASKNTDSNFEVFADEKIKKLKEVNCLSKASNKSSNAEPPCSRKFPSSFSTILLCNDQDISNHCKQIHDNNSTTLDTKSSQDLASLTESSSDISVNRLINKLIENERKLKTPSQPLEPEKTTNASMQNFTSSNDKKLPNSPIELTSSTVNYDDTDVQQSKLEPIIDEAIKCTGMVNEDSSRLECLREIKNLAKKVIDSVLEIKNNENYNRSKLKTYGEIFSQQSSMPKNKSQNTEIKDVPDASTVDSSTDKYGTYSDSSANEKSGTWKSSRLEDSELLHTDDTLDSISSNNVQNISRKHNFEHNWKPTKTKSNLDLTTGDKRQFKSNHRRSKSYVNPRGITDELEFHAEHDRVFKAISSSNNVTAVKVLNPKIQDDLQNELDLKTSESSESLCSKSSSCSIKKLIPLKDRPLTLAQECPDSIRVDQNKKSYVTNKSSLELIPLSRSSSKSSIPVMKNKSAPRRNEESFLPIPVESSNVSLGNKVQDLIYQVSTDQDEICNLSINKERSCPDNFTNISYLEHLKDFEQNTILCYNLMSEDRLISNYVDQKNVSDAIEELNVPDKLVCSRVNNTASAVPETINRPITCLLSDELSELNPSSSFIFQNTISSMSPYQIERKETEVLVKPSTLDISTSMTNFPCIYHFEEDSKMNDVKIFEISDELTKEECIRYLQMFDQDSNHDQSTNTHDFCDKLLEDI